MFQTHTLSVSVSFTILVHDVTCRLKVKFLDFEFVPGSSLSGPAVYLSIPHIKLIYTCRVVIGNDAIEHPSSRIAGCHDSSNERGR